MHPARWAVFILGALVVILVAIVALSAGSWFARRDRFAVYFPGSVRGLDKGSAVTFRGVKVGEVYDVSAILTGQPDPLIQIEVIIEILGDLVEVPEGQTVPAAFARSARPEEFARALIERGIRARLKSASFVTGQKYIDVDFLPDEPARFAGLRPRYPELPTSPTSMEKMGDRAEDIVEKLAALPLEQTLDDLGKTLRCGARAVRVAGAAGRPGRGRRHCAEDGGDAHPGGRRSRRGGRDARRGSQRGRADRGGGASDAAWVPADRDSRRREPRRVRGHAPQPRRHTADRAARPGRVDAHDAGPAESRGVPRDASGGVAGHGQGEAKGETSDAHAPHDGRPPGAEHARRLRLPETHGGAALFRAAAAGGDAAGSGVGGSASADDARVVGVLPLALPGHLERPQFVSWIGPDEMRIDQFVRWAEPLASGAQRVLAGDLATVLPSHRVITAPWPASAAPQYRVRVAVDRFGLQPEGLSRCQGDSCCFRAAASAPSSAARWTCGALPTPVPAIPRARSRP